MTESITKDSVSITQLELSNVSVAYDGLTVVHDVELQLGQGQIGCLLGPSGCGKSTILRAIAGFESLVAGEIKMNDQVISNTKKTVSPNEREIGMVFQDLALFPHITIAENIAFGIQKWTESEIKERLTQLLELVGLAGLGDRYPHSLSGGQQQRVALARAIAPRPKLLLMDEPFSGLDASLRDVLIPEVREILLKEGISVLLVTHDQMEAFAIADKVSVVSAGRLMQTATPFHLYHQPVNRFVADFVGEGDFLSGIVIDDNKVKTALGTLSDEDGHGFAKDQAVEVFVRPDDLLHDDDSEITAKIISKKFRGSHFLYRVVLPSKQALYCFASSHHNHELGEHIGVILDLDHLVMFPQES